MDPSRVGKRGWYFEMFGESFFVTTFGPFYTTTPTRGIRLVHRIATFSCSPITLLLGTILERTPNTQNGIIQKQCATKLEPKYVPTAPKTIVPQSLTLVDSLKHIIENTTFLKHFPMLKLHMWSSKLLMKIL
jgi:hypothetical protein